MFGSGIDGRLLRAARVILGVRQKTIVHEIDISMSTLRCLERQGAKVEPQITRPSAIRLLSYFEENGVRFAKSGETYCGVYLEPAVDDVKGIQKRRYLNELQGSRRIRCSSATSSDK